MKVNVVVVGAGFAGLAACKSLAALARNREDVTVTLLDSRLYTIMVPALPDLAGGRYAQRYLTESIAKLVGPSIVFMNTRVKTIDLERKAVCTECDNIPFSVCG